VIGHQNPTAGRECPGQRLGDDVDRERDVRQKHEVRWRTTEIFREALSRSCEQLRRDALKNRVTLDVIQSDLFAAIPQRIFDWIVINPPYFQGNPQTLGEQAWYAGDRYQFFEGLFSGIGRFVGGETTTCMVLSDACDVARIRSLAQDYGLALEQKAIKHFAIEDELIFQVVPARRTG
jgi:tRNA1(Val) A37 N6-methylase TrmN6